MEACFTHHVSLHEHVCVAASFASVLTWPGIWLANRLGVKRGNWLIWLMAVGRPDRASAIGRLGLQHSGNFAMQPYITYNEHRKFGAMAACLKRGTTAATGKILHVGAACRGCL